jgi:hypothetical protein
MRRPFGTVTRLAAMPKQLRPILLAIFLALAAGAVAGCGGSSGPDPSIAPDEAAVLSAKINEIQSNVAVGSCLVAGDKTDELISDIHNLPSSVNDQVVQALENGANNLKLLLANPDQCQGHTTTSQTTTSTPSTTESTTTTTRTRPTTTTTQTQTQQTTPTQTQTQTTPTPTTGGSGGIGPGGL